jgi:hypothetical protein
MSMSEKGENMYTDGADDFQRVHALWQEVEAFNASRNLLTEQPDVR